MRRSSWIFAGGIREVSDLSRDDGTDVETVGAESVEAERRRLARGASEELMMMMSV